MEGRLTPRNITLVGLVLGALALCFVYGFYEPGSLDAAAQGQTTGKQEFACSGNEDQVQTFSGSQDTTTPDFEITGAEWRFIAQATATGEASGSLDVTGQDEQGLPRGVALLMPSPNGGPDTRSSSVQDGPGTFSLKIDANGVDYNVLVCQSRSAGGSTTPSPTPPPSPPKTTPSPPKSNPTPPPPPPNPPPPPGPIFNAGGPQDGPVPSMPNGSCPIEFPNKIEGACYPRKP